MSYEPVDVFVKDQLAAPIEGVVVKVYSVDGGVFYTQQSTDADGRVSFLLPNQQFTMRLYKFRATFSQPQQFTVLEAPSTNVFDVRGETFVDHPPASDSRLCRCSGYFRDPNGAPQKYLDMHFYPEFSPIVLEGSAVVPRELIQRTDESGYAQIDLIRGGCYRVTIEGMENEERFIRVPDLLSANLPDVLYSVVSRVVLDPPGPYTVAAGSELEVTPTVYDSAGTVLHGTGQDDVNWTMSDRTFANVSVGEFKLTIRGASAGSVELKAERKDQSIIRIPDVPISGQPVTIDIT